MKFFASIDSTITHVVILLPTCVNKFGAHAIFGGVSAKTIATLGRVLFSEGVSAETIATPVPTTDLCYIYYKSKH